MTSIVGMDRVVAAEILDGLPADDPDAVRSRRDLRMINAVMGNSRWLRREVARLAPTGVVEVGAGDGSFLASLAEAGVGEGELLGIDLAPRPDDLPTSVGWLEGDVFECFQPRACVVANLFLHHFDGAQLAALGEAMRGAESLCVCEPLRSRLAMVESHSLFPFVGRVTRHDMRVSIRAGFRPGELPDLLGLGAAGWRWSESTNLLGAYRLIATRGAR